MTRPAAHLHHHRPATGRRSKFNGFLPPFMGPCDHRPGLKKPLLIIADNFNKRTLVGGDAVTFPGIAQSQSLQRGHWNDLIYILKRYIPATGKRYPKGIFPFIGLPGYPLDGPRCRPRRANNASQNRVGLFRFQTRHWSFHRD